MTHQQQRSDFNETEFVRKETRFERGAAILTVVAVPGKEHDMKHFIVKEYSSEIVEIAEQQFERYVREDLEETFSDEILHEKIWKNIFVNGCEKGALSIAVPFVNDAPVGLLITQIDSKKSDWCVREGWGLIREFCIAPDYRRCGYGKQLSAYAVERLKAQTDRVYLTAHDETAVKFWQSCGFAEIGEVNENGTKTMIYQD